MKKAAQLSNAKKLTMLSPDKFEELTGYVHGGCSPFGLKTQLPIFVEEEILQWDTIYISGGRIGLTVEVNPQVLLEELGATQGRLSNDFILLFEKIFNVFDLKAHVGKSTHDAHLPR